MDSRNEIINAACQVFAKLGFRGCTTRRIADAAGVNEVTIFRQFGSKEALIREAMKRTHSVDLAPLPDVPSDPERELTSWSESFIQHLRLRSAIIRKTMGEIEERPEMGECASDVPVRASGELCRYLAALKKQGRTGQKFEPKTAAAMLMGAMFADAMGREVMPDVFPHPEIKAAQMYTRLLLQAIGVENDSSRTTSKQTKRSKQLSA